MFEMIREQLEEGGQHPQGHQAIDPGVSQQQPPVAKAQEPEGVASFVSGEPATAVFRNPESYLKINPNTFLKFENDGFVMLQHMYCDNALRIRYDIMLILYELVEWKRVADLIAPWPQPDQVKILEYLEMMGQAQILVEQTTYREPAPGESHGKQAAAIDPDATPLAEHVGSQLVFNVLNHFTMLRDNVRLNAFRRAIERRVRQLGELTGEPVTVLDVGSGTGILSFFASKAGAKHVWGIEKRADVVLLASETAKANGLTNVSFIEKSSSQVKGSELNPRPQLMVAEIIGDGVLEESILEFTIDARNRLLASLEATGIAKPMQMIPNRLEMYLFPYVNPTQRLNYKLETAEFSGMYGIDFTLLGQVLSQKTTMCVARYDARKLREMGDPVKLTDIDLATLESPFFEEKATLTIARDGEIDGFVCYFKVWLDDETTLTNSPFAPSTHWTHLFFDLGEPMSVKAGQEIPVRLRYDGGVHIFLDE